jgi:outer membrane protein assembly factor BamB
VCLLLAGAPARPADTQAPPAPQAAGKPAISAAVRNLGDASWRIREDAQKQLIDAGAPAIEELRKALQSEDVEVRQRAQNILQVISKGMLEGASQAVEKARLWKAPAKDGVASPAAVASGVVCFFTFNGTLRAVDANTGKGKWDFEDLVKEAPPQQRNITQMIGGLPTLPAPVLWKGQVYVSSPNGRLYALDLQGGQVRWKSATAEGFSPPAVAGGRVYAAGAAKDVRALDAASGKEAWRADLEGGSGVRPVVIGPTVYVAARDGGLYAFDANGARRDLAADLRDVTDLVATADGGLVARSAEGIVRVDLSTGRPAWNYPLPADRAQGGVVIAQGVIGPGGRNARLWRPQREDSLVAAGGALYASAGGQVHAIDAATGKSLWTYKPEVPEDEGGAGNAMVLANGGAIVVMGAQGRVLVRGGGMAGGLSVPCVEGDRLYVASPAGLHGVDLKTHQELWRLPSKEIITVRPAVWDGVLYYGTGDFSGGGNAAVIVAARAGAQAGQANPANQQPDTEAALHAVRLKAAAR